MNSELEMRWQLYGSHVRLLVGRDEATGLAPTREVVDEIQAVLLEAQERLNRFEPDSELSRLNASPLEQITVSPLLELALGAALKAARESGGLVDPTLLPELEDAGYAQSLGRRTPASLRDGLAAAPPRCVAEGSRRSRWQEIEVRAGRVRRPRGVRFDLGGTAKGLIADLVAARLDGRFSSWAIDVGGDLRVGGTRREIFVPAPLPGMPDIAASRVSGAVATSGISRRIWMQGDAPSHHLIDPSTGRPAWTGVLQTTAIAPDGLTAERLAKEAFLRGPEGGLEVLRTFGGAIYSEDGVRIVGEGWRRR